MPLLIAPLIDKAPPERHTSRLRLRLRRLLAYYSRSELRGTTTTSKEHQAAAAKEVKTTNHRPKFLRSEKKQLFSREILAVTTTSS